LLEKIINTVRVKFPVSSSLYYDAEGRQHIETPQCWKYVFMTTGFVYFYTEFTSLLNCYLK